MSLLILFVIVVFIVGVGLSLYYQDYSQPDFKLGVNFSKSYSEYLGLNWQKTYLAVLDELKVKTIRLSAPWNEIEKTEGKWDFAPLDWQVAEATKRDVAIVLVIGRRTPHWPECHDPEWIKDLPEPIVIDAQLAMLKAVVNHYKANKNIKVWQVENEPLVDVFGVCPKGDLNFLRQEVAFVKNLDSRPILVTDSGELSLWAEAGTVSDLFGTTMYRVVYNSWFGYTFYHWPPVFYHLKSWLIGRSSRDMVVAELQAEPWAPAGLLNTSLKEQFISMDSARLVRHVAYARKAGFSGAYLWGVEWWYWLKEKQNQPELWQTGLTLFK